MNISACISVRHTGEFTLPIFIEVIISCDFDPNIARIRATGVAVADGVATISIPATTTIENGQIVDVLLATSIPDGTDGAELVISNGGTIADPVFNGNGNYLRFYPLTSRTILRVQYLNDPSHFQIINVFGRRIKRYA